MIESENLRTASLYINNQLLSRGLLRDGQNIDFADPENDDGGLQATMGRVISVVNDLILRRDRDAAHRESLSSTLLNLRADAQRQTAESTRLSEKLADTQRKLNSAEATENTLRAQIKSTENTVHKLKDEMAKMRTLVAQSRAACATEVRKRDRQIDGLKKAFVDAGRVRGAGRNRDITTITVQGESGAESRGEGVARGGTDEEGYTLRMETNEFLTELAKGLSEENISLLAVLRRTVDQLREMGGLEQALDTNTNKGGDCVAPPQKTADELADELEGIMEHLRTILTNPSFVPIEEVEVREVEIMRLREGWERMESRWKDAMRMIDGWRKRMATGGKSVDMEELQMGLSLSPVRMSDAQEIVDTKDEFHELSCVREEEEEEEDDEEMSHPEPSKEPSPELEESLHLVPAPGYEEEQDDESDASSIFQDDVDIEDMDAEEPNVRILQDSVDSPPLPIPPQLSPLKDSLSSGNRGLRSNNELPRKRHGDFTAVVEENECDLPADDEPPIPPPHLVKKAKPSPRQHEQVRQTSTCSLDSPLFGNSIESPSRSHLDRKLFSSNPDDPPPKLHISTKSQPTSKSSYTEPPSSTTEPRSHHTSPKDLAREEMRVREGTPSSQAAKRTASAPNPGTAQKQHQQHQLQQATTPCLKPASNSTGMTSKEQRNRSPVRPPQSSRLPRPRDQPAPQQSPLTMANIAAKLAASEREANAARVRAKLRAARMGRGAKRPQPHQTQAQAQAQAQAQTQVQQQQQQTQHVQVHPSVQPPLQQEEESDVDPVKRDVGVPREEEQEKEQEKANGKEKRVREKVSATPQKRKRDRTERRTSKAANRRRSTLSPWELESLISGSVRVESPAR